MPRKYEVHHVIIQSLEEKDLSRVDLLKQVRKKSGLTVSDKTLNEALMRLLRDNKITVTGYDIGIYEGISRVQSMKSDGIIFSKVNTDPIEIGIFLKKLESDNLEEAKKALHKLKILFRIKMTKLKGIENSSSDKFDEIFTKILRYINTQDLNQKRIITQRLAWALSDEKDSQEILKQLLAALRIN
ncbi:hypothetical protein HYG87_09025 [Methanobacterium alkalithermotolerans]|uniref:Uncharacterized protein n=1 Tax=Methanobacterium alkalithermotolerans TaxID=2731220 RepID=A0A8T8K8I7_9EURY|nr:hypothetical protein [Methanobacterium alkalithermotolerans]QUH23885.1 hypothetical protein HYG87_09025 [Methanobacterium alkalithermotolerans]